MTDIYTVGFTKKNLKDFVTLLRDNKIEKVIDIRLKNSSQLAGFAKGEDLEYLLNEILKIKYEHIPLLAPTEELLTKYKKDSDWDFYVKSFTKLMDNRNSSEILHKHIKKFDRVCLSCSEDTADHCHRRLIAERYQKYNNSTKVTHLSNKDLEK